MKTVVYTKKGTKTKRTVELADNVFGAKVNLDLMAQAVYIYKSNQRLGTQKTKNRSEVSGGGKKPWKQKTPDKARHGSTRSPIWVGGGRAHSITPRNWRKRLSSKMRRAAIFSALSQKLNDELLKTVENFELKDTQLTKQVEEIVKKLSDKKKVLIVQGGLNKDLLRGAKSLDGVVVRLASDLNIYDLLGHEEIVLLEDAVEVINKIWGEKVEKVEKEKVEEKVTKTKKKVKKEVDVKKEGKKIVKKEKKKILKQTGEKTDNSKKEVKSEK